MKTNKIIQIVSIIACTAPSLAYAYGEGDDINYGSRAIHMLVNDARTDPKDALKDCPAENCKEGIDCYSSPSKPAYWRQDLQYAGELQAYLLQEANTDHFDENLANNKNLLYKHCTPCKLKDTIGEDYPNNCHDSIASCACVGGKTIPSKDALDASNNCIPEVSTSKNARAGYFVPSGEYITENLACNQFGDDMFAPYSLFSQYMFEKGGIAGKCNGSNGNGHRSTICSSNTQATLMGSGYAQKKADDGGFRVYTAQEYGKGSKPEDAGALVAGSHYQDAGEKYNCRICFKTVYASENPAETVLMNFGDQCVSLKLTRGTETYGTYSTSSIQSKEECVPYFFEARDTNGTVTRFPSKGSLLYNCDKSYKTDEGKSCLSDLKCSANQHIHDGSCEDDNLDNCGLHGYACEKEYTNWGSGDCIHGQCVMETCKLGSHEFIKLIPMNAMLSKSCVTDTKDNCGSTGYKCADHVENWSNGICFNAECIVTSCKTGFHPEGDTPATRKCVANNKEDLKCNTAANEYKHEYNGACEENTSSNCGSNGYDCIKYNTGWKEATCSNEKKKTSRVCQLTSCADGYKPDGESKCIPKNDCLSSEHIYDGGCETDDLSNCGSHGNACKDLDGWKSGQCKGGKCIAETCKDDYAVDGTKCRPKSEVKPSGSSDSSKPSDSSNSNSGSDGCSANVLNANNSSKWPWLLMLPLFYFIRRRRTDAR